MARRRRITLRRILVIGAILFGLWFWGKSLPSSKQQAPADTATVAFLGTQMATVYATQISLIEATNAALEATGNAAMTASAPAISAIPPTLDAAAQAIVATQQWFVVQQTQAAGGQAVQFVPTSTPAPPTMAVFDAAVYERYVSDSLSILAGGRNIVAVQVSDKRRQGGPRDVQVMYMTTESTEPGYVDEWIDLFEAVAVSIKNHALDVDSVTLIAATATGQLAGTVEVSAGDLRAYWGGQIDRFTFINRLHGSTF